MAGRAWMTPSEKERIKVLLEDGFTPGAVARLFTRADGSKFSKPTIWRFAQGLGAFTDRANGKDSRNLTASERDYEDLKPKWQAGMLDDGVRELLLPGRELDFMRRFFPEIEDHEEEFVTHLAANRTAMILAHPRSGKSQVASLYYPIYFLCGGGMPAEFYSDDDAPLRDQQIMIVARSEEQAKKNFFGIEARLTLDAELLKAFGNFKDPNLTWSPGRGYLMVAGRRRGELSGDFSLTVVGAKSKVFGRGGGVIILDDASAPENSKTIEQAEEVLSWLQMNIFTRLDVENIGDEQYDARLWVVGARLPLPNDLYTRFERMTSLEALTGNSSDDPEDRPDDRAPKVFATLTKDAIVDYENKIVLAPRRMGWGALMRRRSILGPEKFDVMFRQKRPGAESKFSLPEHIYGGRVFDERDQIWKEFPGCVDDGRNGRPLRTWGQPPEITGATGEKVPSVRVMTVDPSPLMYAGNLIMDIPDRVDYSPHLIDIERAKMPQPVQFGHIVNWWEKYRYRVLVIEENSAKGLIQTEQWSEFISFSGIAVVYHSTGMNKNDTLFGEQSLQADVAAGRVRIPWGDTDTQWKFRILVQELLEEEVTTTDCRMALWFPKWNLAGIRSLISSFDDFAGLGGGIPVGPPPRAYYRLTKTSPTPATPAGVR